MNESWEERMSQRAKARSTEATQARMRERLGEFARYARPDDPEEIRLEILAARCLGFSYGDPGPRVAQDVCRECWGERYVWLGNTWGLTHIGGSMVGCGHDCHIDEIWLASA